MKDYKDANKDKWTPFKNGSGLCSIPYIHYFYIVNERKRDYNISISILQSFNILKSAPPLFRGRTLFIYPYR